MESHSGEVRGAAFSPDGKFLAVCSEGIAVFEILDRPVSRWPKVLARLPLAKWLIDELSKRYDGGRRFYTRIIVPTSPSVETNRTSPSSARTASSWRIPVPSARGATLERLDPPEGRQPEASRPGAGCDVRGWCDLGLMSSLNDVKDIPKEGKNLIIVAAVKNELHFRIFDGDGQRVVDTDEKRRTGQARQIEDLRKQLESLWPPHKLTRSEKGPVITAVASIVGHIDRGGRTLVVAGPQSIRLWDLDRADEKTTLAGHTQGVPGVAFSPDGKWLVSVSKDRTVRVWDPVKGVPLKLSRREMTAFAPPGRLRPDRRLQPGWEDARHRGLGRRHPDLGCQCRTR